MKKQVCLIHGGNAYSRYEDFLCGLREKPLRDLPWQERPLRWSERLREDLGEGFEVFAPTMPNKQNAKYAEWKLWFERYLEHLRNGAALAGWSLGGGFLVKYLTENVLPFKPAALFLLAAPFALAGRGGEGENREGGDGGEDGGDFVFDPALLAALPAKVGRIFIFHSRDDAVVPFSDAERYAAALPEANLAALNGRGHLLTPEFPEFLERLREL
jgi:predicted alpha/beta hydrolase family esterase